MQNNAEIAQLRTELFKFFNHNQSLADSWLSTPLPVLDGEAPLALMKSKQGRARLREVLEQMRFGDFA